MQQSATKTHLVAAILFLGLALIGTMLAPTGEPRLWRIISDLCLIATGLAIILHLINLRLDSIRKRDQAAVYPLGPARKIDNGRLPNRFHPRVNLSEYEYCHFSIGAWRIIFIPPTVAQQYEMRQTLVRFTGGLYYFITQPQAILLRAEPENQVAGELVITSQRIIFLADENGFEIPLKNIKCLDCSAHLVDFQVRDRRYTLQTDAASYAEKVLAMLLDISGD